MFSVNINIKPGYVGMNMKTDSTEDYTNILPGYGFVHESRPGKVFSTKLDLSHGPWIKYPALKAPDTFGNCQRPVFSRGVSKHNMHTCENLGSNVIDVVRE